MGPWPGRTQNLFPPPQTSVSRRDNPQYFVGVVKDKHTLPTRLAGRTPEKCSLSTFRKSIFRNFTWFSHEDHREGQDLNNRMCSHNLDLATRTQTFMLDPRPNPSCPWHPWNARHTGRTTSPKKSVSPDNSLRFLCVYGSSYDYMSFCSHMSTCDMNQ